MKELESRSPEKITITKEQEKILKTVFDGKIYPKKGHSLFEINLADKTISLAVFEELPPLNWEDAVKGNLSVSRKVIKKQNCIYVSALNKENALKKIRE